MLTGFLYVTIPDLSGDCKMAIETLLLSNNKRKTFDHVKAVAEVNVKIAEQYVLDKDVCEVCGYLHDISSVVAPNDMLVYAIENGWYIDESEKKYPFLLHQRMSKVIANQDFGIEDERILSAVECHSTLKANPSAYDMALFVSDKLAWDQEGLPPFYVVVNEGLKQSLEAASLAYMDYIVENKIILLPHRWFEAGVQSLRRTLDQNIVRRTIG